MARTEIQIDVSRIPVPVEQNIAAIAHNGIRHYFADRTHDAAFKQWLVERYGAEEAERRMNEVSENRRVCEEALRISDARKERFAALKREMNSLNDRPN